MNRLFRIVGSRLLTSYGVASIVISAVGISFVAIHTDTVASLLASSLSSLEGATTTVFFRPYGDTSLQTGDTVTIDVNVNTKIPINAMGASVSFPKDSVDIIGMDKEKSFFNLWTEDTSISEDSGEVHFSGGTTKYGGMVGTGTVITLTLRAKKSGTAQLRFSNIQVYPDNGTGNVTDTATHPISFTIADAPATPSTAGGGSPSRSVAALPSPDLNGDGVVNLIDFSILTVKMLGAYNARYDLNLNGSVGLDDISILLSKI